MGFLDFLANQYLIASLLALSVGVTLYIFLIPRSPSKYTMGVPGETLTGGMRAMAFFSTELHAALPASVADKLVGRPTTELENLIRRSGNPWKIKPQDFRILQITGGIIGIILGMVAAYVVTNYGPMGIPLWAGAAAGAFLGFVYPKSTYNSATAQRDIDFKRQLPEALDLLIIALSAGTTFGQALKSALPQMKSGILKDELQDISRNLETGKTLHESLGNFAERAPTESIKTFVRAVQEATELNVPIIEVLESRADASRKEFFALLQEKTASLEGRMMMVLIPTVMPALIIVLIAPSIMSIVENML